MTRIAALALALLLCSAAAAQPSVTPGAAAPAASPPAKIADAAWLQGYWVGEGMGGIAEDLWMPPRDGVMIGSFRLKKRDGSRGFYELFGIEEFEGTLRFVVKHFHPDWVGWEEKDQALKLRLTKLAPGELTFGGIVFRRDSDTALSVLLTMRTKEGTRVETFTLRKQPL
jgi:hypothetical protein